MKTIYIKYSLFLLVMYIYLYNPIFQFLDFGMIKIVLLLSIIYIVIHKKTILFITIFSKEILFTLILTIYSSIAVFSGNGTAFAVPYTHIVWFLECFVIPFFFMLFFKNIFQERSWESIIVHTGLIASLITFFLILNPDFNSFIRDSVIRDPLTNISDKIILFRGFTIAENSTFSFGVVQGIILSICIISLQKNYLYAIPIIFLFISILFNARIGLVITSIAIVLLLLSKKIKTKHILIFGSVLYFGYLFLFKSNFAQNNLESLKWGFSFFEDSFMFINGHDRQYSNFSVLNDMVNYPPTIIGIIFGDGRTVLGEYKGSDIGYINQIFIGGLFYLLIMLSFMFYMFTKNIKYSTNKTFSILFFLTLLIVNFKGDALFVSNGFFRLIASYYVYCILTKRTNNFCTINENTM